MTEPRLFADGSGIWREDRPGRRHGISWTDIFAVSVHRLDLIDSTCLVIEADFEFGEHVEFNELWQGFDAVVRAIAEHLADVPQDWYERAQALAPSAPPLTIWSRPSPSTP